MHGDSRSGEPRGWHSRLYLPHFDAGETPQTITFRLAGSLPTVLLRQWRDELRLQAAQLGDRERSRRPSLATLERQRIEDYLNRGIGPIWLGDPRIGSLVEAAFLFFDGSRYRLHAWVVMPNHVHIVLTPDADISMTRIVSSWKSFTATRANELLGRTGAFWQADYFDRFIRDEAHFLAAVSYVEQNPVVGGLCAAPEEWAFSSASWRSRNP
ncbi:MAG: transposase [Chloroflexota bacterium]